MPRNQEESLDIVLIGGANDGRRMTISRFQEILQFIIPQSPHTSFVDLTIPTEVFEVEVYKQACIRCGDVRLFYYHHSSLTSEQALRQLLDKYPQGETHAPTQCR